MWQHASIFVVTSEQLEKNTGSSNGENRERKKRCQKKKPNRESKSCHLLAGSTSSKLKEKNQVGQQGGLNFVCKK